MEPKNKTKYSHHLSPLAKNLRKLLADKGINQRTAAKMAGVSVSTINDWTAGATPKNLSNVAVLAKQLGVSFEFLCLGTTPSKAAEDISTDELFEEVGGSIEGIYRIVATKLVRRGSKR